MSIIDTLNKLIPDEIIDGSSVKKTAEMVGQDGLDLAWKLYLVEYPVQLDDMELHFDIPNVSEGKKRSDGKYEIRFQTEDGPDYKIMTPDETMIMRARFLLLRGFYTQNMDSLTLPKQNEAAAEYDITFIPDMLKG